MRWGWIVVVLIVWWIVVDPNAAATAAHNIGHFITNVLSGHPS